MRRVIKGRYQVIDTLGMGSLGTVYLCDDILAATRVAVKVFPRAFARDHEFMDRLRRQVKRARALGEKNSSVLAVYDCDHMEDGCAFIATEYLQGRTLKDVIRRGGPLEVRRALRLACQIAGALDAIHNVGLVHTEVRAENVIIMTAGEEESARLKGLEVAGLRETALVGHLIRAGIIPSNPEYATPEQVEGDQVTARTDIYSFGVLLYEMLSGRVPFSASIPDGVLAKHLQEVPVALSTLRREIPTVLELRVKQALEKEPEKRQRYVGDVVNEYLCELAMDELASERARQKRGAIGKIAAAVQSRLPELAGEGEKLGTGWKVGAAVALLALISVLALWMFFPVPTAERVSAPPLERPLAAPRVVEREPAVPLDGAASGTSVPAPTAEVVQTTPEAGQTPARVPEAESDLEAADEPRKSKEAMESTPPPLPRESSLRPPGAKRPPQTSPSQPVRSEAPVQAERRTAPPRAATPPAPPAPSPAREAVDPTAIIDWLLGQPSGRE